MKMAVQQQAASFPKIADKITPMVFNWEVDVLIHKLPDEQ